MKHEFSNKITEECIKEFFPNLLLDEALISDGDEIAEDFKENPKAMIEYVADRIYEVLYDSIAFDCDYFRLIKFNDGDPKGLYGVLPGRERRRSLVPRRAQEGPPSVI